MYGNIEAFGRYDYLAYAKAAQSLINGISPYHVMFETRHLYLYPPLLAQILMPFIGLFGERPTAVLWFVVNIACIIGTIQLMRLYTQPKYHIGLWIFPILFTPFIHTLDLGQVTVIMMFLFMLIWHDYRQNRHLRAGIILALLCWLKVYPVFIVIFFIIRRDWRVMQGVVLAGLGLGIIQILISGIDIFIESFVVLFTLVDEGQTDGLFKNSSITGFTARLFTEHPLIIPLAVNETLFTLSRYGLMGITALITYIMSSKRTPHSQIRFDIGYASALVMALMMGYTFWISGMAPLFVVFWLGLHQTKGYDKWILLCLLTVLSAYFPMLINMNSVRSPWWSVYSFGFYATYALWGLLVYKLAQRQTVYT